MTFPVISTRYKLLFRQVMLLWPVLLILFNPLVIHAQEFGGHPPGMRWRQINSPDTRIIFPEGLDSQAQRIRAIISRLDSTTALTIGGKSHKWNVLLLNRTTVPNAYVRMAPIMSEFYMTPGQNNFSTGSIRWDDNLVIHEDRHMQQFSNFNNGITKVFSFLLGEEGQLLANGMSVPDYFFEGDATFQETLVSRQGRGRMPSFFNGWKALWYEDKNYSWMKLRSGSLRDYTPDHYTLGYTVVAYGYEKYGSDFWRKVTQDATRFRGFFYPFNKAVERHSGKIYAQFTRDALAAFRQNTQKPKDDSLTLITAAQRHNVVDYQYPHFAGPDTLVVTRQSYREINSFYLLANGKEKKIRVKDYVLDDYFSYRNGLIVYAAYRSDPRWLNRNYSELRLLDVHTGKQRSLSFRSRYFSPDINEAGTEVVAVHVAADGRSTLHRLNTSDGSLIADLPNPENYFFTQTKYLNDSAVVSAVRQPDGTMALLHIHLRTGESKNLTPFTYRVLGYPYVSGDAVYFSMMGAEGQQATDQVYRVSCSTGFIQHVKAAPAGIYHPTVDGKGRLVASVFTASGHRLFSCADRPSSEGEFRFTNNTPNMIGTSDTTRLIGAGSLYGTSVDPQPVTRVPKNFRLFNFHSARPFSEDPEWGYRIYGDNILSTFTNTLTLSYNRNEGSNTFGYDFAWGGWYPVLRSGVSYSVNRYVDTAVGAGISFNSARVYGGLSVPLSFIGGRTFKYLRASADYFIEQVPYIGIGKDVFSNKALHYSSWNLSFSNVSRQARQHILPRYAQSLSLSYRESYTFQDSRKLVANAAMYWPGFSVNHNLVLRAALQRRDTLPDLFSNNFPYSRGYQGLSTRQMMKWGADYHFPLFYPDAGIGNIFFIQRIRSAAFFDYTVARARISGLLTNIVNRSVGGELYADGKLWNALPFSIGLRYSRLLDTDLRNPQATGRWEIILPINLIPD